MKTEYLINQYGQYIKTLTGTTSEIIGQIPPNHSTVLLPPPRSTDYWTGTDWMAIGSPPAYYFKFDYVDRTWKDSRSLSEVKTLKWEEIKLERNKQEFGGFVLNGKPFDSDYISQGRILAAYLFNQPVSWTLADDTVVELSVEEIQQLALALGNHVTALHRRGRLARDAINAANTISEVESVLF